MREKREEKELGRGLCIPLLRQLAWRESPVGAGPTDCHANFGQLWVPPWCSLSRQRMWYDKVVLSRRDQKSYLVQFLFRSGYY
jgi:hypothetical protein